MTNGDQPPKPHWESRLPEIGNVPLFIDTVVMPLSDVLYREVYGEGLFEQPEELLATKPALEIDKREGQGLRGNPLRASIVVECGMGFSKIGGVRTAETLDEFRAAVTSEIVPWVQLILEDPNDIGETEYIFSKGSPLAQGEDGRSRTDLRSTDVLRVIDIFHALGIRKEQIEEYIHDYIEAMEARNG